MAILINSFSLYDSLYHDNPTLSTYAVHEAVYFLRHTDSVHTYSNSLANSFVEINVFELASSHPDGFGVIDDWYNPSFDECDIINNLVQTYSRNNNLNFITRVRNPDERTVSFLFQERN